MHTFTLIPALLLGLASLGSVAWAQAPADPAAEAGVSSGVTLWRFPGPYGEDLRAAVLTQRGPAQAGHRIAAAEVAEHLAARRPEAAALGCLSDAALCADAHDGALRALGVGTLVTAEAERLGEGWRVTVRTRRSGAAAATASTGEGADLGAAVAAALGQATGEGQVRVTVSPPDAVLELDGQPWATGAGLHAAPPGKHRLRLSAPGHQPIELEVSVEKGETTVVTAELVTDQSVLALVIDPPDAVVLVDGEPVDPARPIQLSAGDHVLTASAPGKAPHTHRFTVEPATRLDLSLTMRAAEEDFWSQLQRPHPDTVAKPFVARASLRFASLGEGPLSATAGADADRVSTRRQTESLGLFGIAAGGGWRDQHLMFDPLAFEVVGGDGPANVRLDDGRTGQLEDFRRLSLKLAWVGFRWPAWRFDPYLHLGPVLAWDSFDIVGADGQRHSFDQRAFLLGLSLGARFHFSDQWFVQLAYDGAFWFGERTASTFVLGGGWAFDFGLPEWL